MKHGRFVERLCLLDTYIDIEITETGFCCPASGQAEVGVECESGDKYLGRKDSLNECASECQATEGCEYFVYGTGWKTGMCFWEKTTSADCPEGWEKDHYNFYSLSSSKYRCK